MSTAELSVGARIHYIFQSIFVKSLEDVDPCEDVTDEDIRMAIQNSTGPKDALFVPEVPFEVLVRRQIGRLLDPSLQCVKFIYDELIKMSHRCLVNELQRFPIIRKCMDEVIGKFLRDSLQPAETMITHIIAMEVNHTKRELHNVFIRKLYRENLFEDMLREPDDIMAKRKRIREILQVLQQANKTLDELPLDAETAEKGYSVDIDSTGLPRIHGLPSSFYAANSDYTPSYMASPTKPRHRKSAHSGEQPSPMHSSADSNGSGYNHSGFGSYPVIDP